MMKKQILMSRGTVEQKPQLLQAEQNHSAQGLRTSQAAEQNFISNLNQTQQKLKWNWNLGGF